MPKTIRFVDLARQEAGLRPKIRRSIEKTVSRGDFTLGKAHAEFEKRLARYVGARHAVGTSSGGAALEIILRALGVGPGDEVIVQANSYVATAYAALYVGAKPVLVDCRAEDFQMDPRLAERAVTERTKAIIATHLYGYAAPLRELASVANRRDLFLVEDAAQAAGTEYRGRRCGCFGTAAAFSFYPSKNLGCWGDGGAITTDDTSVARKAALWRSYGDRVKNTHTEIGMNARLDTLQAAILNAKLPALDAANAQRRKAAAAYDRELAGLPLLLPPLEIPGQKPNFHLYVVRTPRRDALRKHLAADGIETGLHYPIPIHLQPVMKKLKLGRFPISEAIAKEVLSLPMYAGLSEASIRRVAVSIRQFFT